MQYRTTLMIKECQNSPHFTLITDNAALGEVCRLAREKSAVALDTEFVRVSTYFPKLGLIQLYDGERVSLIDPLAITYFSWSSIYMVSNINGTWMTLIYISRTHPFSSLSPSVTQPTGDFLHHKWDQIFAFSFLPSF